MYHLQLGKVFSLGVNSLIFPFWIYDSGLQVLFYHVLLWTQETRARSENQGVVSREPIEHHRALNTTRIRLWSALSATLGPMEGHQDDQGIEASILQGEAERTGIV